MMFEVGERVVCVDDDWSNLTAHEREGIPNRPVRGNTYTVRDFMLLFPGDPGVRVEEITNPTCQWMLGRYEGAFRVRRFRPLRKTDISSLVRAVQDVFEKKVTPEEVG